MTENGTATTGTDTARPDVTGPGPAGSDPAPADPAAADPPPADPPGPGPAADPVDDRDDLEALPRTLEIIGSVVAPTTLLTALLFYFGLLYAVGYYRYFGVNFTVLDLPAQGFLVLSASTAVVPLALFAVGSLLSLGIHRLPLNRLAGTPRRLMRWAVTPAVAVTGAVLVALVAADTLSGARVFPADFWEARGLSLTIGLLLLVHAARMWRVLRDGAPAGRRAPDVVTVATWGSLFILVGIGLFWAVGSYAIRVGTEGAQGLAADLRCEPDVVLHSERSLNLVGSGVREERPADAEGAYGFRYPGLKLVPQSGDQYLVVPADWTPGARPAIVLPRSDTLRLEFVSAAGRDGC